MRWALLGLLSVAGCATARGAAGAAAAPVIGTADQVVRGCVGERCGELGRVFRVELGRGDRVLFRASSEEIDPVLVVTGPDAFRSRVDDAFADRRDAAMYVEAPARGTYVVEVQGATETQSGLFDLHSTYYGDEPPGDALALDGSIERTLPAGGLEWLHLEAEEGMLLRVRVTSDVIDPFVTVFAPTGRVFSNDDAYDTGASGDERRTDSTVQVAAPASGRYLVAIGAFDGLPGRHRVTTRARPPVRVDDDDAPPESGWAGPDASGRVHGLFVGIGAYPSAPLYGTADDATFLAEAFRAARLMREEDGAVLRDAEATREAVLSGVAAIARRARPEDVVVIFYSGHGEARPVSENDHEIDGLDETLVLVDGELTDTELVHALDAIDAGTLVLAVDACLSGGFADDFMQRPGRIGLFSSDADVLSHTAESHRAGGYLSVFLRRSVLGGADTRPRDGFLQAGELTDALYESFVTDHRRINPTGDLAPLQRLVVDRGSVRWDTVLWAYPRDEDGSLPPVPDLALESAEPSDVPGDP